ncbi:MAG TPA: NAD(P)-dependent oxidoreductase [Acidimicrobiia bacterium]|nr:NAD(P)-dependent oxidoreductase [Acidimicrobiia bacterium]
MPEQLGFIGIGTMGAGMARNLVAAGHRLVVWNRTSEKARLIEGATVSRSLRDLATAADIVMICVSDTPDVESVVLGADGLLTALRPGTLIVDHSTISPTATRTLDETVRGQGCHWLDAPVSGGPEGASRGTLTTMVGGDQTQLDRARPYLEAYSALITHVGPVGAGQLVKLVNQILVVGNQLAASEALLFAQAAGLNLVDTLNAVKGGAAGSWMLSNRGPQMIVGDWRPGFTIDLQQKDLRLALAAADELGVPLPGTALIFQLYRALQRVGLGDEGNHALIKALQMMAGFEVKRE